MKIWDITPLVTENFPFWPGSTPLKRTVDTDLSKGDKFTCSTLSSTVHMGAHADATSHYAMGGKEIHESDLNHFLGLVQVIRPHVKKGEPITLENMNKKIEAERVLFATGTFDFTKPFQEDYSSFSADFFEYLGKNKVITVGIDVPSVDVFSDPEFPCHQLANKYGIAILENLDLKDVPEGLYELIALPLKIKGFDASPVRAVLKSMS